MPQLTSSYDGSKNHWGTWFLAWLYSERLLCFFGLLHFVATMAVWFHFGYIKFRAVEAIVPNGANLYWWKRLVPPLEFGAMHAILLQMALLPLTMCRYTLTKASENSTLASIIPFKRMTRMHIHLGYCMIGFVAASTVLFFIFFGQGCADQHAGDEPLSASGEKTFCTKMHGEIMLTGYGIFAALFLVGVTSYLRNRIKYEYFYAMHHFVFVMFALAIAHTIDDLNRRGKARSQTFIWFSASLTWYVADRVYMWTQIQQCPVVEWRALGGDHQIARAPATSSDDKKQKKNKKNEPANDATNSEPSDALKKRLAENKVLILRLRRPPDFDFQPGQFAYLHVPSIDRTYHPYSIASAPQENTLDFYVEVAKSKPGAKTKTWTEQLWEIAKGNPKLAVESYVTVQGPYGSATSLGEYRKVLAVGSGTGIVPMISMMKSVYFKLFQRNAQMHQMNQTLATQKAKEIRGSYEVRQKTLWQLVKLLVLGDPALKIGNDVALEKRAPLKESMKNIDDDAKMIIKQAQLVWRSRKIKEAVDTKRANPTSNAVIRTEERMLLSSSSALLYFIPPVIEFTASIFAVSWRILNHSHGIVTDDMQNILLVLTCIGISLHALYWLTHVGIKTPYFLADTVIVGVGILSAVEWDRLDAFGKFSLYQCLAFLGLSLYRFYRLWSHATLTGPYSHLRGVRQRAMELVGGGDLPDQFELIFVTRSAPFAMHLWWGSPPFPVSSAGSVF